MKQIYIKRKGDSKIISDYKTRFEKQTLEELVAKYNGQVKCGIVGVHRQGLYLLAMRFEFLKKMGESPVTFQENCIIGLLGKIDLINGQIRLTI